MLEMMSSQFDSFLFWRQPIPSLDLAELEDLGLAEPKSKSSETGKMAKIGPRPSEQDQEELELADYTTFNFWKDPIASIDTLDFNLLL